MGQVQYGDMMSFSPIEQRLQHTADSIKEYLLHHVGDFFRWLQISEIPIKVRLVNDPQRMAYRMEIRCSDWIWTSVYDQKMFEEVFNSNPQYLDHVIEQARQGVSAAIFNEWFSRLLTNDPEALQVYKQRVGSNINYVIFGDGTRRPNDGTVVRCVIRNTIQPYIGNVAEIAKDPRTELARMLMLIP